MISRTNTTASTKAVKRSRAPARPGFDPERRASILHAALQVFVNKGFHRTTIRDIAKAANLAEGTLYNHFENKTALITALIEQLQFAAQQTAGLPAPLSLPSEQAPLPQLLTLQFTQMLALHSTTGPNVLGVLLAELLTDAQLRNAHAEKLLAPVFKTGAKAMKQWTQQGQVRSNNPELTTRLIGAMLLGVQVQQMLGDAVIQKQWKQLPKAMAELVMHGLEPKQ